MKMTSDVVKDLGFEDKDLRLEDKDKDLWACGPRTRTYLKDNSIGLQ